MSAQGSLYKFHGASMTQVLLQAKLSLGEDCLIHSTTPPGDDAVKLGAAPGEYLIVAGPPPEAAIPATPKPGHGQFIKIKYGLIPNPNTEQFADLLPPPPPVPFERDEPAPPAAATPPTPAPAPSPAPSRPLPPREARPAAVAASAPSPGAAELQALQAQMAELRQRLETQHEHIGQWQHSLSRDFRHWTAIVADGRSPAADRPGMAFYRRLCDLGLEEDAARSLAASCLTRCADTAGGAEPSMAEALNALSAQFAEAGATAAESEWPAGRPRRVAFVGPPGAGKTMALAKFALSAQRDEAECIAIVNADGVRPGAETQLNMLGQLTGLRVAIAVDNDRAAGLCQTFADEDMVLVDTPGFSFRSAADMKRLADLLRRIQPDETHLVLPADLAPRHAVRAVEAFSEAGADRLLLSKSELCDTPALPANLLAAVGARARWSWIGAGASYTSALCRATPELLAGLALGLAAADADSGRIVWRETAR